MRQIKILVLSVITLLFIAVISSATYFEHNPDKFSFIKGKELSSRKNHQLNTYILGEYNIESYGYPFGEWLPCLDGRMTKNNDSLETGEYQYLGYNFYEEVITNDRYFRKADHKGNLFDQNYSNTYWTPVEDAEASWIAYDPFPQIRDYILKTPFWDSDHISAYTKDTGYTIESFCRDKHIDYKKYALVMTSPTKNTSGTVKFEYQGNGKTCYNTVEIPPLPHVKGYLNAYTDIKAIPAGEKRDIVVTLDTSGSYVFLNNKYNENVTNRTYWACSEKLSGSGSDSTASSYKITVPDVTPNSTIEVQVRIYSKEVDELKTKFGLDELEPYDTVTANIHIGEVTASPLDFTDPSDEAVIKADMRGSEKFDVTAGIPSGEKLYTMVKTKEYLYKLEIRPVSGSVTSNVTVRYKDDRKWEETSKTGDSEKSGGETGASSKSASTTASTTNAEGGGAGSDTGSSEDEYKTVTISVPQYYTYYEIASCDIYALEGATVVNTALPGGSKYLTPNGYKAPEYEILHDPNDRDTYHVKGGGDASTTSSSSNMADIQTAAQDAAPKITVQSDRLKINDKLILDPDTGKVESITPPTTGNDVLYASNLKIDEKTMNNIYKSTCTINYKRIYPLNSMPGDKLSFNPEINSVVVHTPVYVSMDITSDDAHNQKVSPSADKKALILGRPFTINVTNKGNHRDIHGYGYRRYDEYITDTQICFNFDTYYGSNMNGTYIKQGTWHSIKKLIDEAKNTTNDTTPLTFYTPTWVDEGSSYKAEIRSLALNDTSKGVNYENKANTNRSYTVAYDSNQIEVSGRVYDLSITDIDDFAWELFFRKETGKVTHTGKVFYTGKQNVNGTPDPRREHVLPVMPGKNDVRTYEQKAVKIGYAFQFEIKTMGNYYDMNDHVIIKPTFSFVDRDGKKRQEVDLYYSTPQKPLVKIGSKEDTFTHRMKLNFKYRGITDEFKRTAEAMFKLRGGIKGFKDIKEWENSFPLLSQNGYNIGGYTSIKLSEPLRIFMGPDKKIPQGASYYKSLASVQKWYGEFRLPSDCLIVPKGHDLSKEREITRSSPFLLKDGFVLVNFSDISVINNGDFDNPTLKYIGKNANAWSLEGYNTDQGGWQLVQGDVLAYYADMRATDDITGAGTH